MKYIITIYVNLRDVKLVGILMAEIKDNDNSVRQKDLITYKKIREDSRPTV